MRPNEFNDTDWLAFLYIAGDLPSRQVAEFESRLESDEAAQQALSKIVELSLAISAARAIEFEPPCVPAAETSRRSSRYAIWLSGCLAASAAVLLTCWLALHGPGSSTRGVPDFADSDPVQLAIIWNETRSALPSPDEWSVDDSSEAVEYVVPEAADAPDARDEPDAWAAAETPPWVWAAVTVAEEAASSDESESGGI
ncbi:MAG: hypothetical protein JJ992_19025 [Planctomycetes bacterium]|nr:hypothetical protein [Planctomycetota bacterium]